MKIVHTSALLVISHINECNNRMKSLFGVFIYLFGVLRHFQHCTGQIMTGSWKGRGNQYIQFVRVLYCKLPINGKQLPAFPLEAMPRTEPRPQSWEARVLPLCHRGPPLFGVMPLNQFNSTSLITKVVFHQRLFG